MERGTHHCVDRNELFELTRVFDSVVRKFVSMNFDTVGIRWNINMMFQTFLNDRPFSVNIGEEH